MPVVADELLRVRRGFEVVAAEVGQARTAVADADARGVGTAGCDTAVAAGLRDLHTALARLETVSADCLRALGRYDGSSAPDDA